MKFYNDFYPSNVPKCLHFLLNRKAWGGTVIHLFLLFLGVFVAGAQQLDVSISQTGATANSCSRTLTAQVQNGSGNYSYSWSVATPGIPFPGPSNLQTVHSDLSQTVDFTVFVEDNVTNQTGSSAITVPRILSGGFDTFIPNVFTPNGDGYNDEWLVVDSDKGFGPINVYYFKLIIRDDNNTILYQDYDLVTSGHLGVMGGEISWNGKINGTGNDAPLGLYYYSLKLINCSFNQNINGNITIFR